MANGGQPAIDVLGPTPRTVRECKERRVGRAYPFGILGRLDVFIAVKSKVQGRVVRRAVGGATELRGGSFRHSERGDEYNLGKEGISKLCLPSHGGRSGRGTVARQPSTPQRG